MTKKTLTKILVPLITFLSTSFIGMMWLQNIISLEVTVTGGVLLAFAAWIYLDIKTPERPD